MGVLFVVGRIKILSAGQWCLAKLICAAYRNDGRFSSGRWHRFGSKRLARWKLAAYSNHTDSVH